MSDLHSEIGFPLLRDLSQESKVFTPVQKKEKNSDWKTPIVINRSVVLLSTFESEETGN